MIDSCSNSRRTERKRTYQLKNQKQKKSQGTSATYTNNYIKCVSADESGLFRTLMFTYDPAFKPDSDRWNDIVATCEQWNIELWQIIYEEPPKKKNGKKGTKKYNSETVDQLGHFKSVYRDELEGTMMFHDGGPAYKLDGHLIFDEDGCDVRVLPSIIHGEVSTLDNNTFGTGKGWWRDKRPKDDPVLAALYLMYCIDSVGHDSINRMFKRNLFMGDQDLSLTGVGDFVSGKERLTILREKQLECYLQAYTVWMEEKGQVIEPEALKMLGKRLDGGYWTQPVAGRRRKK